MYAPFVCDNWSFWLSDRKVAYLEFNIDKLTGKLDIPDLMYFSRKF